ncbi:hypothetical protein Leryth_024975 [Lithospermum erythrorhizon]|nr:hypothetical protein Leryth_024975 [Lithospermum erythrorhizon]
MGLVDYFHWIGSQEQMARKSKKPDETKGNQGFYFTSVTVSFGPSDPRAAGAVRLLATRTLRPFPERVFAQVLMLFLLAGH